MTEIYIDCLTTSIRGGEERVKK